MSDKIEELLEQKHIKGPEIQNFCKENDISLDEVFRRMTQKGWKIGTSDDGKDEYWAPDER